MKILSVNNTADLYGASRCMERVFGRFAQAGHEVHAVLPENGPLVELLEAKGVHVHVHRGLSIFDRSKIGSLGAGLRFLVLLPVSVIWLAVLILRHRIDVVHTNTAVMPTPAAAAFLTGRRHVWHIRELLTEFGKLWKPYQRYVAVLSNAIVAISQCTKEQFDPAIREKVKVIYDGLDDSEFKVNPAVRDAFRVSFPKDKLLVGVVGRIKWHRKGQEVLVRAAGLLKQKYPNVLYILVGSTSPGNEDHEVRLRELITSLGLENDINLVGETGSPHSVFAALDIAVVPSIQPEPFGCVVIESMAAGTPVVGSDCGGIAEQIVDGVSGLLFVPGDAEALAQALERLYSDEKLRARISVEGHFRVSSVFPLEGTYRAMAELFDQITGIGPQHISSERPYEQDDAI
jgi:glycosyltransferase involved in cell wall biosynthesis